jgi:hypothetical protein
MYNLCTEFLNKQIISMVDLSCFMWMVFSTQPNKNDVEPCFQFLIHNGVPIDDVQCFD